MIVLRLQLMGSNLSGRELHGGIRGREIEWLIPVGDICDQGKKQT